MRKTILFAACLVFSMGTCSQARQPDAGRNPYEVKHSIYFEDNTLDEYVTSAWDSSYSNIINQARFSASGAMLEQVELTYNERDGQITTKITKDSESRMQSRVAYQYNKRGLLETEALRDRKNKPVSTYLYAYDDKGYRTERTLKGQNDRLLAKTVYEVEQGRIKKSETKDASEIVISYTLYTYDPQGNLTKQEVFNGEGKLTSIINSVWQNGKEVKNEMLDPNGRQQLVVNKTYGQDGELLVEEVANLQGESKQILKYEYIYRPANKRS